MYLEVPERAGGMDVILRELIWQKRNDLLDTPMALSDSDPTLWRNGIPYDVLKNNVYNFKEDIRLNTLALVVESKKSTSAFSKKEFDIILRFLEYNVGERLEYVPLMKKAFKRFHDSLAVMQRQLRNEEKARIYFKKKQHALLPEAQAALALSLESSEKISAEIEAYKSFFKIIGDTCVNSLHPDAVYHKRRSALQMLCLMKEVSNDEFKDIEWTSKEAEVILKCLLLETYEQNKALAFEILKVLDITLLRLNEEDRVFDLLTVALELGNSIRPIDTITAVYVLKLCVLSPVIQNVVKSMHNENICSCDSPDAAALQIVLLLMKKLQDCCTIAKKDIVLAVTKHSLYGYIFCLRSLISDCNLRVLGKEQLWQDAVAEMINLCFELNEAVSVIVNNSSPEGHLPMDLSTESTRNILSEAHEKMPVTAQMVLLCSWRTVKEVSLFFGLLPTKSLMREGDHAELLTDEQIIKIGEHLVTLLCETKHRGAFEQAHVGFQQLCTRLWRLKNSKLSNLPMIWLHQILVAITGFAQENSKLCATRRSAGVPFMIQALLSSEPRIRKNEKTKTFRSVMEILLSFTELQDSENLRDKVKQLLYQDTAFSDYEVLFQSPKCINVDNVIQGNCARVTELKTHALNILRAVFRDSQFGELVNDYVADGLIASFNSYDSTTWGERNAATLLFSALIVRIFGVQRTKDHINLTTDNKMSGRIFFERYPALQPFVLNQLSRFTSENLTVNDAMKSNVHPILLLLSRLYLSEKFDPVNSCWSDIIKFVSECAISPVYETRKLAARALVPLVPKANSLEIMKQLVNNISEGRNDNASLNSLHGYLLQIQGLIEHYSFETFSHLNWNAFLGESIWILQDLQHTSSKLVSFPLAKVYIDVLRMIDISCSDKKLLPKNILTIVVSHLTQPEIVKDGPQRELYKIAAMKLILSARKTKSLPSSETFLEADELWEIYIRALETLEPDLQLIVWSTLNELVSEAHTEGTSKLCDHIISTFSRIVPNLHNLNPELQDAIYDFLYTHLHNREMTCKLLSTIVHTVLYEMRVNMSDYYKRDTYIRLLGESYITFSISEIMTPLSKECIDEIYESLCDYTFVGSLDPGIRSSVFKILFEMYLLRGKKDFIEGRMMLWWTTIMQLLIHDDNQVRHETSRLICQIGDLASPLCFTAMIEAFTRIFCKEMSQTPVVACALFFYWSISLLGDTAYEMDETDVFNKCRNYDVFEPVSLATLFTKYATLNFPHVRNKIIPDYAVQWISGRLNTDFPESLTFSEFVKIHEKSLPKLDGQLGDILNPTYKEKLLYILSYQQWDEWINKTPEES